MTDQADHAIETEPEAADATFVLTLRKPVEHAGVTYTELTLREPTAGEWAKFDKLTGVDADIMGVSLVSGVPEEAVEMLTVFDLRQCSEYVASFFEQRAPDWRDHLIALCNRFSYLPDALLAKTIAWPAECAPWTHSSEREH